MPNWKKVITSGSSAELSSLFVAGAITASSNITSSDVYINDWGSVSASLASSLDEIQVGEGTLSSAGDFGVGSRVFTKFGTLTVTTAGTLYYLDGTWAEADADAASTATNLLAVAVTTSSNNGMLCEGFIKMSTNTGFSGASVGDPLYISTTAGQVTSTAPSGTGDIVRIVGYVVDATDGVIYFNPSNDWIEIS